jgi:hypothetical protein
MRSELEKPLSSEITVHRFNSLRRSPLLRTVQLARRAKVLADEYMSALGLEGAVPAHVKRVAELMALAEQVRSQALAGKVEIERALKCDYAAAEALRSLKLPPRVVTVSDAMLAGAE